MKITVKDVWVIGNNDQTYLTLSLGCSKIYGWEQQQSKMTEVNSHRVVRFLISVTSFYTEATHTRKSYFYLVQDT